MRIPTQSSSFSTPGRLALSDSEKAEAHADNLEAQFQPVNDTSVPASLRFNKEMRTYSFAPTSEPKLTNCTEVQDPLRSLKVGKSQSPYGIPNTTLKRLPLSVVTLLFVLFYVILRTEYLLTAWKHANMFSTLKPGRIRRYRHLIDPYVYWPRLANCL
jgi:hypothetical protein